MTPYLETAREVYRQAALKPDIGLCCTTTPIWKLPGLSVPKKMLEMNYGCGTTVHPRDLSGDPTILYVGVGGGMELLQFSYFSRRPSGVIGVDTVDEMIEACEINISLAVRDNTWLHPDFIELRKGDALSLPVESESIDVAAQNCLFNIFKQEDLKQALKEMYRVLRPGGKLILSDPICEVSLSENLKNDSKLRALCLSGAIPLKEYLNLITDVGFGTVEIRARRPYRVLSPGRYDVTSNTLIESVEICAIKNPIPFDGPCIFTGKTAIYFGEQDHYDDGKGHVLTREMPLSVCDKTAKSLSLLCIPELLITGSTYFYDGGGCC